MTIDTQSIVEFIHKVAERHNPRVDQYERQEELRMHLYASIRERVGL